MEVKFGKSEIIEAIKDVVKPLAKDILEIKNILFPLVEDVTGIKKVQERMIKEQEHIRKEQEHIRKEQEHIRKEQEHMSNELERMSNELVIVNHELAKRPERGEFKYLLKDSLQNDPAIYSYGWEELDRHITSKVREILKEEKVI
ncbi:MAG: hypothetical protein H7844_11485 [Nitrospirae bacterium YQR-1]